jgi:hypothetical protein
MSMYNRGVSWSDRPIAHAVSLLAFLLLAVLAVLVGAVIFSFLFGIAVLAGLVFYARLWWLRRKGARVGAKTQSQGRIIEAQYEVVRRAGEREHD